MQNCNKNLVTHFSFIFTKRLHPLRIPIPQSPKRKSTRRPIVHTHQPTPTHAVSSSTHLPNTLAMHSIHQQCASYVRLFGKRKLYRKKETSLKSGSRLQPGFYNLDLWWSSGGGGPERSYSRMLTTQRMQSPAFMSPKAWLILSSGWRCVMNSSTLRSPLL